mmetsp:Transcript_41126/g.100901  ORF Transcript_41126/g.100901 Transcript_41126/m.100901 type:complete len:94 (-) Transcript_41126:6-287(-)
MSVQSFQITKTIQVPLGGSAGPMGAPMGGSAGPMYGGSAGSMSYVSTVTPVVPTTTYYQYTPVYATPVYTYRTAYVSAPVVTTYFSAPTIYAF